MLFHQILARLRADVVKIQGKQILDDLTAYGWFDGVLSPFGLFFKALKDLYARPMIGDSCPAFGFSE